MVESYYKWLVVIPQESVEKIFVPLKDTDYTNKIMIQPNLYSLTLILILLLNSIIK